MDWTDNDLSRSRFQAGEMMKLDYSDLISPFSFYVERIGHVKTPTLRDIWNPRTTWQGYQMYLGLLLMTPQACGQENNISMFDLIRSDIRLQTSYAAMFDFFLEENILWDENNRLFFTYKEKDKDNQIIPVGMICAENFSELCDIILQKCGIARKDYDVDASKIKNKRALEILTKIRQGRQQASGKSKHDKDMDLPNLVTAVAVKSNSINFTNIWDLTIYQFYEQFKKEQVGIYFDIQKMSVAAYGNTKNTFKGNEWYKNEN
ncbi:hypothetical protein NSA48_02525 [Frisingicoccus caecimuris]|mgnify:FL=1|uniref:Uncharacterized protein n=1 Tax=Frisingicoccus caecimuris TaxID=1796636 RepID=A0A4R2LLK8_9FIRM|nr:hypothetical protein [Frisingicoccus caecimuris]MCR1917915.1 hypothetical protein [Frisingicoccus caecimuris]TCO86534.1 hypothetical protein EV212_101325 [Frisingicoccus caecimuris]